MSAYLIDWITLRTPVAGLGRELAERMKANFGHMTRVSPDGEVLWTKPILDFDTMRSDSDGLFWQLQGAKDGQTYLAIGASPASLDNDGLNVFGHCDVKRAADTLLGVAGKSLGVILPHRGMWSCSRLDVTANYVMPDSAAVDFALHQLMRSDGTRRKASNRSGNTVYWGATSKLRKGKAYNKGRHLRMKARKGFPVDDETLRLADRLLRLELTLANKYFKDRTEQGLVWSDLTEADLALEHRTFFEQLNVVCEVESMEREDIIQTIMERNGITEARARAAYKTYVECRRCGSNSVQLITAKATWYRHMKYLNKAGVTVAHIKTAHELPFRRVQLIVAAPVASWNDVRMAA